MYNMLFLSALFFAQHHMLFELFLLIIKQNVGSYPKPHHRISQNSTHPSDISITTSHTWSFIDFLFVITIPLPATTVPITIIHMLYLISCPLFQKAQCFTSNERLVLVSVSINSQVSRNLRTVSTSNVCLCPPSLPTRQIDAGPVHPRTGGYVEAWLPRLPGWKRGWSVTYLKKLGLKGKFFSWTCNNSFTA